MTTTTNRLITIEDEQYIKYEVHKKLQEYCEDLEAKLERAERYKDKWSDQWCDLNKMYQKVITEVMKYPQDPYAAKILVNALQYKVDA